MRYFFAFLLFANSIFADVSSLLAELAQTDDLSKQTKKETAGYLTVYTRADLDQMRIKNLSELIDQIPFFSYREDRYGFTDPLYDQRLPETGNTFKVYIDERELLGPYNGNGLQLYAQISLEYIDHIEIYTGVPSLEFGILPSFITIKCYTKDPQREMATVLGGFGGSYGQNREYAYTANSYKGYDYFIDVSRDDAKRKKTDYRGTQLSRDKKTYNLYAKVLKNDFKFDMQLARSEADAFMGSSFKIDPLDPHVDVDYAHFSISYNNKDDGIEALLSYTTDTPDSWDESQSAGGLGYYKESADSIPVFYTKRHMRMKEKLYNAKLLKRFKTDTNTLLVALQARRKYFKFTDLSFDDRERPDTLGYSTQDIYAFSAEDNFLLNESNMLTASFLHDKVLNNSVVKDYTTDSFRVGYIYNSKHVTSKTYFFSGEMAPNMKTLHLGRAFFFQTQDPKMYTQQTVSTKLIYKTKSYKTSLLAARTLLKDVIYTDGSAYKNLSYTMTLDSLSYRFDYFFDAKNKLLCNAWINYTDSENLSPKSHDIGGFVTLFNQFGKFSLYNNLTYSYAKDRADGYNYNATLTYAYSRALEFYIKGNNILDKIKTVNYTSYAPGPPPLYITPYRLSGVEPIEQSFLIGMEYQF